MNTVALGNSSLQIPRLGLGAVQFGREIDEKASWDVLDHALANGINLIDTAEAYGGGNSRQGRRDAYKVDDAREVSDEMHSSEKILGRWMKARSCRDRVILCTKFSEGGRAGQVRQSLQNSLSRLQTDRVDIYMLHMPFPDVPIQETLEALTEEVRAGRVRAIGCSNFNLSQLQEARETAQLHGLARVDCTEPGFSLAQSAPRNDLLPYCQRENIAAITYSPLAAGFLAGKYSPGGEIPKGTRFDISPAHGDVYFSEKNFQILRNLRELSAETGHPITRLAMAWVYHHPGVSAVLIGARTRAQVDNAIEAANLQLDAGWKTRMDGWL